MNCLKLWKLSLATALPLMAGAVYGADVTKAATGTDLADGASWGGTAPTATDVAVWEAASLGEALTLETAASWLGINLQDALTDVGITGAGGLTVGTSGISVVGKNLTLGNAVTVSGSQLWSVAAGQSLQFDGNVTSNSADTLTLSGEGTVVYNRNATWGMEANLVLASDMTLALRQSGLSIRNGSDSTTGFDLGGFTLTLDSNNEGRFFATDDNSVVKNGTIHLTGNTGDVQFEAKTDGTVDLIADPSANFIVDSTRVNNPNLDVQLVGSNSALRLSSAFANGTLTIGNLTGGSGSFVHTNYGGTTGTRTLEVTQSVDGTFAGNLNAGSSGRILALTKSGAATLTLTGNNTLNGGLTVAAGTLLINSALPNSTVTVNDGATLGGTGALGQALTVDGILAPGDDTVGIQTADGGVTFGATGQLNIEVMNNNVGVAGTDFDQLDTTTATFDASSQINVVLNATGSTTDFSNAFWDLDQQWVIVTTDNPITQLPALGTVSVDSQGAAMSGGYFELAINGNQLELHWIGTATPAIGLAVTLDGEVLSWQADQEIGVKNYQVQQWIDGVWVTVETLEAGHLVYEAVINPAYDVRLLVEDANGFTQSFSPVNAGLAELSYELTVGWNLISIPFNDADLSEVSAAIEGAPMVWNGQNYEVAGDITAGTALFVYVADAAQATVRGTVADETLTLVSGWNLCGVTQNTLVPEEAEVVYTLDETYQSLLDQAVLIEGVGYWIYVK